MSRLTPALTAKVNKVNRLANCGWYTCIEFAIADTAMLEALAGDMAAPRIPDGPAGASVMRSPLQLSKLSQGSISPFVF